MSTIPSSPPVVTTPMTEEALVNEVNSLGVAAIKQAWSVLVGDLPNYDDLNRQFQATWHDVGVLAQELEPVELWNRVSLWDLMVNCSGLNQEQASAKVFQHAEVVPIAADGLAHTVLGRRVAAPSVLMPLLPIHHGTDGTVTVATDMPMMARAAASELRFSMALAQFFGAGALQFVVCAPEALRDLLSQLLASGGELSFRAISRSTAFTSPAGRAFPRLSLRGFRLPQAHADAAARVSLPISLLNEQSASPIWCDHQILTLAVAQPLPVAVASRVSTALATRGFQLRQVIASVDEISGLNARAEHSQFVSAAQEIATRIRPTGVGGRVEIVEEVRPITIVESAGVSSSEAAVSFLNNQLAIAIQNKSSELVVKQMKGGILVKLQTLGAWTDRFYGLPEGGEGSVQVLSRLKVLAGIETTKLSKVVDGQIKVLLRGKEAMLRLQICPDSEGERATMRVQDNSRVPMISELRMPTSIAEYLDDVLARRRGMFLLVGSVGTGKTTTLHAMLSTVANKGLNIAAFEAPIERNIPGVHHVLCDDGSGAYPGMTFAEAARAALRQKLDISLIGETRDEDTLSAVLRLAQTGQLALSTLHANFVESVPMRLLNLGRHDSSVTAVTIASVLLGALAQQLVVEICEECAHVHEVTDAELNRLGYDPEWMVDAQGRPNRKVRIENTEGCPRCTSLQGAVAGRIGRRAVFETLVIDEEMRDLIMENAAPHAIRAELKRRGSPRMIETAVRAAAAGEVCWQNIKVCR